MTDNQIQTIPIVIETDLGTIDVAINAAAPITSINFLTYVDGGWYDGGVFHRTVTLQNQPDSPVKIEVIQGGVNPSRPRDDLQPIPLERTTVTGLRHVDGAISMARFTPDSAVSDFFICINDQPDLDFGGMRNVDGQGFAAFGQVTSGMDVVRAIQTSPSDGQSLSPAIPITRITRR